MLLPEAQRRDEIRFYLAKSLPYSTRLKISFSLVLAGFIIQILLFDYFWAGLPFLFAGVLIQLSKGFDNKPEVGKGKSDWRPTTVEEVSRIIKINDEAKAWDQALVDISCVTGFMALLFLCVIVGLVSLIFNSYSQGLGKVIAWDSAVLFLPFWFTGVRSILLQDQLLIKVKMLLEIEKKFSKSKQNGEEFQFQIRTAPAKDKSGELPQDVKAIILIKNGPPEFIGLQMQVVINNVQGTSYPYFYCVLVAKEEFGSFKGKNMSPPPKKVKNYFKKDKDIEIAIIRQETTKKTGYHTKQSVANKIFEYSLGEARKLTKQ